MADEKGLWIEKAKDYHPAVIEGHFPQARTPDPWEMQPGEPGPAYNRFCKYRETPPARRSVQKVAEEIHWSLRRLQDESLAWNWRERARSWDHEIDRLATERLKNELVEMRVRHAQVGQLMVSKAVQKLVGDEANGVIALDVNDLTPRAIALLIDEGVKIERISRGEATERTELVGAGGGPIEIRPVDYRQIVVPLLTGDDEDELSG